jgi:hypothetical protein
VSTARAVWALGAVVGVSIGLGVSLVACSREQPLTDERRRPLATGPATAIPAHGAREYEIAPSPAELTIGPRQRRLRGHVQLARGRLWLDVNDLGATRASLTFDLASLVVDDAAPAEGPDTPPDSRTPTEQSLDWLEIRDATRLADSPLNRFGRFDLSSFVPAAGADHRSGESLPSAAGAPRRVLGRATGELELHGYRLPYTVVVAVTFNWLDPARFGGPPQRVELALAEPASVEPLRHEVVPRNARGEIQSGMLAELRKLQSNTVQISGRWVAEEVERRSHP